MHELAFADRVLDAVVRTARGAGADRVLRVRVRVGALSCLSPAALVSAFGLLTRGTPLRDCVLLAVPVPAVLSCRGCGTRRGGTLLDSCPSCGGRGVDILEGREAWIESVEVDVPDPEPRAAPPAAPPVAPGRRLP